MSGIYGTIKPANIDPSKDVEIFYNYSATRYDNNGSRDSFIKIESPDTILETCKINGNNYDEQIPGLYNLRLSMDIFNQKGFYTIYIRPKEIDATIIDIGTLAAYNDIRGIVLKKDGLPTLDLTGYRVEFLNEDMATRRNEVRIITSSNRCEAMSQAIGSSSVGEVKYKLISGGNNLFCTVTPSLAVSFNNNIAPFIGETGQHIKLINTKFNPIMLEIEMTNHDLDTISWMLENEQIHDVDHGIITTFDDNGQIYHQVNYKAVKDSLGEASYTIKEKRERIDETQNINTILGRS